MKKVTNSLRLTVAVVLLAVALNGCLISKVEQPASVKTGAEFSVKLTITDMTADSNPHGGAIAVLAPSDWDFVSGTYNSQVGTGSFALDNSVRPVYGNLDSVLVPPAGMKWIKLLSDKEYTNQANVVHQATIKLKVGQKTGDFKIGYFTTKNSKDLLGSLNKKDVDNDQAWADTAMNNKVNVSAATAVQESSSIPSEYLLDQNFPNPFNPSTVISFSLPKESNVKLTVYNSVGQEVAVLINGFMQAGRKNIQFNATKLTSGTYFYKLVAGSFSETRKMLLMK